jgi:CTP:molybdopterin cytidylyltransferase MocA
MTSHLRHNDITDEFKKEESAMATTASASALSDLHVVLLAGGGGSKLYPLTEGTPKPLLGVANRPLLSYQLELLERLGVRSATVVTVAGYHSHWTLSR